MRKSNTVTALVAALLFCSSLTAAAEQSCGIAFTDIEAGAVHTCGLASDGKVTCWGSELYGEATPSPGTFIDIEGSPWHVCGLRDSGAIECWGADHVGQS